MKYITNASLFYTCWFFTNLNNLKLNIKIWLWLKKTKQKI